MADILDIDQLKQTLRDFCDARDWTSRSHVKSLAMAAAVEMGELMEVIQWHHECEADALPDAQKAEIADELADTINNLVMLADQLDINISAAIAQKIQKNALKYPVGTEIA